MTQCGRTLGTALGVGNNDMGTLEVSTLQRDETQYNSRKSWGPRDGLTFTTFCFSSSSQLWTLLLTRDRQHCPHRTNGKQERREKWRKELCKCCIQRSQNKFGQFPFYLWHCCPASPALSLSTLLPSSPHPLTPWVSSLASSCTGPWLFIECQMPRVVFASSCRSVPCQVPGLVENQNQKLEVREIGPGWEWGEGTGEHGIRNTNSNTISDFTVGPCSC